MEPAIQVTGTRTGIRALTFHQKSMLRTSEKVDVEKPVGDRVDVAMEMQARRKAASRRTAWIIGAHAHAFFISARFRAT
jgi:hypothetical protein